MSSSVAETTELADVAMLLETRRIKRVPVLRDGKLVGIVSRANLVRALAVTMSDRASDVDSDDRTIRDKLLAELMGQQWFNVKEWFKIWAADIIVRDRVVHLWFAANHTEEERRAARIAAENTAGVRRVEEHIVPSTGSFMPRVSPGSKPLPSSVKSGWPRVDQSKLCRTGNRPDLPKACPS
jgi:hypothetical protein